VVDEGRILRLLRSITDDISVLKRESGADESRRGSHMAQGHMVCRRD
jgi:hypothetical protein